MRNEQNSAGASQGPGPVVSDQTSDLSMLLRAFDGTARSQTSISTLRLNFDAKTQRCVSKNDLEVVFANVKMLSYGVVSWTTRKMVFL